MVVEETNDLKQIFFDEYEGFADKRFKNIDSSSLFIIDDRTRKLEFLVGLDVVFQRRSIERSVSAHQRLGEAGVQQRSGCGGECRRAGMACGS